MKIEDTLFVDDVFSNVEKIAHHNNIGSWLVGFEVEEFKNQFNGKMPAYCFYEICGNVYPIIKKTSDEEVKMFLEDTLSSIMDLNFNSNPDNKLGIEYFCENLISRGFTPMAAIYANSLENVKLNNGFNFKSCLENVSKIERYLIEHDTHYEPEEFEKAQQFMLSQLNPNYFSSNSDKYLEKPSYKFYIESNPEGLIN